MEKDTDQRETNAADEVDAGGRLAQLRGILLSFYERQHVRISMALLCSLLLSLLVGYSAYSGIDTSYQHSLAEYQILKGSYEDLNAKYESSEAQVKKLDDDLAKERSKRSSLQSQIDLLQDQQATVDDEKAKLEELQGQLDTLQAERDSLLQQVDAKKLQEEKAAEEAENRRIQAEKNSAGTSRIVYWTPGGKVYHLTLDCPTLKRSKNIHSGSVSASGKSRCCKVCG